MSFLGIGWGKHRGEAKLRFEARLREEARTARLAPPDGLREAVLAAIEREPRDAVAPRRGFPLLLPTLAAAAGLAFVVFAIDPFGFRAPRPGELRPSELPGTGQGLFSSNQLSSLDSPLLSEFQLLQRDTTNAVGALTGGIPGPLRTLLRR